MKILLDACVPRPLRTFLANHTVKTAQEMGWGKLKNGALLQAVEAEFDASISTTKISNANKMSAGKGSPFWFCRPTTGPCSAATVIRLPRR